MDNIFYHKDCGGTMSIDILRNYSWKTPSVSLTQDGIRLGVTEFRGSTNKKGGIFFSCSKCAEEIPVDNADKVLELECSVCADKFPLEEMGNCRQLQCVCSKCQDVLTGKTEPTTPRQKEFIKYIFLGKQKDIVFVPVKNILAKSVLF